MGISGEITACLSLSPPSRTGLRPGKNKAEEQVTGEYLNAVPASFSGDIAADELYDGPFCVLSIVDNRSVRCITYEVLDHDPAHADMERFFRTFQSALDWRGLALRGVTTDGSALYPKPISKVFEDSPHHCHCTPGVLPPCFAWAEASITPIAFSPPYSSTTVRRNRDSIRLWSQTNCDGNNCSVRTATPPPQGDRLDAFPFEVRQQSQRIADQIVKHR